MSNVIVESLFIMACFLPPLAVAAGVLLAIGRRPAPRRDAAPVHVAQALR